ncbi:hypothetical protein BDY24DRAFT_428185 [Mrakia frigida]|uniref:uncharacterized protein n=1 Tax=Mrakia frigida TaxID=29902 RepID=UPI003FCC1946
MLDRRETLKVSSAGHLTEILLTKGDAIGQAFQVISTGRKTSKESSRSIRRFLSSDLGIFFLSLMLTDLAPTLAAISNISWVRQRSIHHSAMCDFQGAMNQFGVTGSAVFNLFLAIQTFMLLVLRVQPPKWLKWISLTAGWMFPILMTSLGPALNQSDFSFFGPTSAGCWLTYGSSNFKAWFWTVPCISLVVLLIMVVLYFGLYLSLSGILDRLTERSTSVPYGSSSSGTRPTTIHPIGAAEKRGREVRQVARKMLWYPAVYSVLSLPIVVSSLLAANGTVLPHMYFIVADCLFSSLGIADVLIFVATRRHLLTHKSSDSSGTPSGQRGITMNVTTFVSSSPQWDSGYSSPPAALSYSHSGPPSPFGFDSKKDSDSLSDDDIISPGDKGRNDGGVWDGPARGTGGGAAMSFGAAVNSISPPPSRTPSRSGGEKPKRHSSRLEMVAKSQGHEDSRGLVTLDDLASEKSWDPNSSLTWETVQDGATSRGSDRPNVL